MLGIVPSTESPEPLQINGDNMNITEYIPEHDDKSIPYAEWLNQLPSDVPIETMTITGNFKYETDEFGLTRQVGGTHYQGLRIQPMEYSFANKLNPIAHSIVKYVTRAGAEGAAKNGIDGIIEDIKKTIHCGELWLDLLEKYSGTKH